MASLDSDDVIWRRYSCCHVMRLARIGSSHASLVANPDPGRYHTQTSITVRLAHGTVRFFPQWGGASRHPIGCVGVWSNLAPEWSPFSQWFASLFFIGPIIIVGKNAGQVRHLYRCRTWPAKDHVPLPTSQYSLGTGPVVVLNLNLVDEYVVYQTRAGVLEGRGYATRLGFS